MGKAPEIEALLNLMTDGRYSEKRIPVCATCGKQIDIGTEFRDALSVKEFKISHMCQKCQDKVFG